jgi:hypothetical protein
MSVELRLPIRRSLIVTVLSLVMLVVAAPSVVAQETEPDAAADTAAEETQEPAEETVPEEPQMATAQRVFMHSAKVVVNGKAQANGVLTMIFEPNGGEAKKVRVNVIAKTSAKKIGKEIANQLAFTVGGDYKVKGDGAKVTVKAKNKKAAPFWLGIENQQLTGVAVMITKG